MRKSALRSSLTLAVALLARPGAAQETAADELYRRGVAEFDRGNYQAACRAFADSFRADPLPGALFTLATCEMRAGRSATAAARYDEFIALVATLPAAQQAAQEERRRVAARERDRLRTEIPYLVVEAPGGLPQGSTLKLDGVTLDRGELGSERPVDPGEHVVEVIMADGTRSQQRVTLAPRERKSVVLAPMNGAAGEDPKAATPAPAPHVAEPDHTSRTAAYALGGLGLAGVVTGAVAGGLALRHKGIVDDECDGAACSVEGKQAADAGRTEAAVSTIAFGVGGAALAVALVLYVNSEPSAAPSKSSQRVELLLGPSALSVRGAF